MHKHSVQFATNIATFFATFATNKINGSNMQFTYKPIFNRKNVLDLAGCGIVEFSINWGKRKYLSTQVKVEPKFWDASKQRISVKHNHHISLNRKIVKMSEAIEDAYSKLMLTENDFTIDELIEMVKPKTVKAENELIFVDWCLEHIENNHLIENSTKRAHKAIIVKLNDVKEKLRFSEIDYVFILQFDKYIKEHGYMSLTLWSQHKTLKSYINKAILHGLMKENPYSKFKISRPESGRLGLERYELEALEELKYGSEEFTKQAILDIFLFSCYTGMRFSDLFLINSEKNVHRENNETIIRFVPKKTSKSKHREVILHIELLFDGKPKKIFDKYFTPLRKTVFPPFTNQVFNRTLKEVSDDAGVRPLSTHLARHTFGTNIATVKPDPYLIMELMGLTEMNTALTYIHQSEIRIKTKLQDIDWNKI